MKRIVCFVFLLGGLLFSLQAQITSTPSFPTVKDQITILFNATEGTGGLKNFTGDVYAHTGVNYTSGEKWQGAPTWGDNAAKYKLTRDNTNPNLYRLVIEDVIAYYNLPAGKEIKELCFVFRSADKTKEGKGPGGTDIFLPIYKAEDVKVLIAAPLPNQLYTLNQQVIITANASKSMDMEISVNGVSLKSESAVTAISSDYTLSAAIDYKIVVKGEHNIADSVIICVPQAVVSQPRPQGLTEGIRYKDNSTVQFAFYAPGKKNAFLIGEFNNWAMINAYQMKKDGDYFWYELSSVDPAKEYAFQYCVDGNLRITDAYCQKVLDPWNDKYITSSVYPDLKPYPDGKTEGLVSIFQINEPTYSWETTDFAPPSESSLLIYEMLFRDFTTAGSVKAAIAQLDYIQKLGFNAIELMPITEFDGNDSWGYNPNHYFATDKAYGTKNDYKLFIDECHKRGIAVVIDMVFNHATGTHPFAKLYWDAANNRTAGDNPWFNVIAKHPFNVFHDFNHEFAGTRDHFKKVMSFWLTEFKVDGFRFDLSKGFTQFDSGSDVGLWGKKDDSRINILNDYQTVAKNINPKMYFILEHLSDNTEETILANNGMMLWGNMNNAFCQSAMGFVSNSDFSRMIGKNRGWQSNDKLVGYMESHDEERVLFKTKTYGASTPIKTDLAIQCKRLATNAAFGLLLPGPKMIWQFGEVGYDISIDYNGRTGKKPVHWEYISNENRRFVYDTYALLSHLKKTYTVAFANGSFAYNVGGGDWNYGRRMELKHGDLDLIVLGNFKDEAITAYPRFTKAGTWYNYITGESFVVSDINATLPIPANEFRIFTDRVVSKPASVESVQQEECFIYPTYTSNNIHIQVPSSIEKVSVYDIQGVQVSISGNQDQVSVSHLKPGIYLMRIKTSQGVYTHRFVRE